MRKPEGTALPPDLEARLAAAEAASADADFDGRSWFWMLLLGVALPIGLIVAGWICGADVR